jgi:hypothetical protein
MKCDHRNLPNENYSAKRPLKGIFYTVEGEIEELENLMSDIRAKITDSDILEKEEIRKLEEKDTNGAGIQSQTDAACSLEDAPIIEKSATEIVPNLICEKSKEDDRN